MKKNLEIIDRLNKEFDLSIDTSIQYLLAKDQVVCKLIELVDEIKDTSTNGIEWIPVSIVAADKGLTSDAVRKQLQNGDFEEGLDFQYKGARIQIHQGAIERISRKRRSSNVK